MWNRMTPVLERRRIRVPAAPQEPRREIAPPPAAVVDSIVRFHLLTCLDVRIAGRVSVGGIAVSGISVAVVAARCCSSDGSSTDGALPAARRSLGDHSSRRDSHSSIDTLDELLKAATPELTPAP
jgi:hypothetical protein